VDYVTEPSTAASNHLLPRNLSFDGDVAMRKPFEKSFASKTVVAKLIELGYLNNRPILTNKTVRVALERLQTDLCRSATIQVRVQRHDDDRRIE
jgi:hypothetical protein